MEGTRFVLTATGTGTGEKFYLPVPCDCQLMELAVTCSQLGGAWASASAARTVPGGATHELAEEGIEVTAAATPAVRPWPAFDQPDARRFHKGDLLKVQLDADAPGGQIVLAATFLEG